MLVRLPLQGMVFGFDDFSMGRASHVIDDKPNANAQVHVADMLGV